MAVALGAGACHRSADPPSQDKPPAKAARHLPRAGHVIALGASRDATAALLSTGEVVRWGDSIDLAELAGEAIPTVVDGFAGATQLAVGGEFLCALVRDQVLCWGDDRRSQLGHAASAAPGVTIDHDAVEVAVSGATGCARMKDGTVQCWGSTRARIAGVDRTEQPPTADFPAQVTPAPLPAIAGATALVVGNWSACARVGTANVCWGTNMGSQLGPVGDTVLQPAPNTALAALDHLAIGDSAVCGIDGDGHAVCTGRRSGPPRDRRSAGLPVANTDAELGAFMAEHDRIAADLAVARTLPNLEHVRAIALGSRHGCAITGEGHVACWGDGERGQLGDGSTRERDEPGEVPGTTDAVAIAAGRDHTCVLTRARDVLCWGNNVSGQLGDPSGTDQRAAPAHVVGLPNAS